MVNDPVSQSLSSDAGHCELPREDLGHAISPLPVCDRKGQFVKVRLIETGRLRGWLWAGDGERVDDLESQMFLVLIRNKAQRIRYRLPTWKRTAVACSRDGFEYLASVACELKVKVGGGDRWQAI